jgi:hypothetical protein
MKMLKQFPSQIVKIYVKHVTGKRISINDFKLTLDKLLQKNKGGPIIKNCPIIVVKSLEELGTISKRKLLYAELIVTTDGRIVKSRYTKLSSQVKQNEND